MAIISERQSRPVPAARAPALRRWCPAAAAVAVTALLAGCQDARGPLAARDAFFASPPSAVRHIGLEAGATIESHQELVAIQRACGAAQQTNGLQEETGILCGEQKTRFFGRQTEAYQRWVLNQVRELPEPGATASSASE